MNVDCNPNVVDFPIPANDDSIKTIKLILDYIADSIFNLSNVGKDDSSDIVHDEHEVSVDTSSLANESENIEESNNSSENSSDSK